MLRNRRKNTRRRNTRNTRNRNSSKNTNSDDDSFYTSDDLDSVTSSSDLDDDSDSMSEEDSSEGATTIRRKRPPRTKKQNRNRNHLDVAGPSSASNSSNNTNSNRGQNKVSAKRKCKERTRSRDSEESSSDDFFARIVSRSWNKRLRRSEIDTDDSDGSIIQHVSKRRTSFIRSDSSSSSNDEIKSVPRRKQTTSSSLDTWSDASNSSMVVLNTTEEDNRNTASLNSGMMLERQSSESDTVNSFSPVQIHLPTSSSSSPNSSLSSDSSPSTGSLFSSTSTFNSLLGVDSDSLMASNESSAVDTSKSYVSTKDQAVSSDSDSNDPEGEKCAICLKKFRKQQIGNPSNCEHNFCVACLREWSKSSNTCPVDRSVFEAIVIRNELGGNIVDRIEVQSRNFAVFPPVDIEEVLMNDTITCERCGSGEDEETLLLCDFCNLGYHMACLDPPLQAIPADAWYCPPCRLLNRNPQQNMNEAMRRLIDSLPLPPVVLSSSSTRQIRNQRRTGRARFFGPPPRGRGPTLSHRRRNHIASDSTTNVIEAVLDDHQETLRTNPTRRVRKKPRKRNRRARRNANLAAQVSRNLAEIKSSKDRISRQLDETLLTSNNTRIAARPSEIVDMVFPSFRLFDNDDLNYFSDDLDEDDGLDGEVAIMARVRSEYSARRIENRKNMVSNLVNFSHRGASAAVHQPAIEDEVASSSNLLDSILESQTLWHSKNVEISSKKDGSLEIKLKDEGNKKPDLSNTNHSSKEIPLYPNKKENSSSDGNRSYANNSRYSSFGGSSSGGGNSFGQSTSSFSSLNPSTRPGFSNILGNSSPALDLSPFRGSAPIRFRMNPPRSALRRPNYNNANSARHSSGNNPSMLNSMQSRKSSSSTAAAGGGDDDVDLYDDIESDNVENDKVPEMFASLEPPPEPPALLIGSDSSSDEDNGLVIDDKASAANRSNIYDPTEPNEDSDVENYPDKNASMLPGYLRSPSYGGIAEFGPHLPLPEPPALPIELESVNNSDSDDEAEAECPNMTLYSSTSIQLANNVQDIPIPDSAYPTSTTVAAAGDLLDFIPIPNAAAAPPSDDATTTDKGTATTAVPPAKADELYSPSRKDDSADADSSDVEEIMSDRSSTHSVKVVERRRRTSSAAVASSTDEEGTPSEDDKKTRRRRRHRCRPRKSRQSETPSPLPQTETPADESSLDVEIIRSDGDTPVRDDAPEKDAEDTSSEPADGTEDAAKRLDTQSDDEDGTEGAVEKADDVAVASADAKEPEAVAGETSDHDEPATDEEDEVEAEPAESKSPGEPEPEARIIVDKNEEVADDDGQSSPPPHDEETAVRKASSSLSGAAEEAHEATAEVADDAEPVKDDDEVAEETSAAKANSADVGTSNAAGYLLPSEDLDPVSDVEYNDFPDYQKQSSKERRKKRKRTRKRDSSAEPTAAAAATSKAENRELEEGEIEEERTKKKHASGATAPPRKRRTSDSEERLSDKKQKRRRGDRKERSSGGKENKVDPAKAEAGGDFTWKKLSKSTKERNYRDGKARPEQHRLADRNRERESTKKKEKRKEMERYDVRKILSDRPRTVRDEFGRDVSAPRTRSRSLSPARSYSSRRRSKGPLRRSFSQDDRWIDWSPVWTQQQQQQMRRSRSRTRRSRSRSSRNRNRHSGDRYGNRSKVRGGREHHEKRGGGGGAEMRKRKRSLSLERYSSDERKRRRSKERGGGGYARMTREAAQPPPDYFYERSWSRSPPSYASLSPEPAYVGRYERSPSMMETAVGPQQRLPVVSPEQVGGGGLSPNPTLTVIVPNMDAVKKKHKKKKDGKKKKKKQQPSKEVFTSGDNIVVSVNFDDNQKIISAKSSSSKRKQQHDEEKASRKKKKDETAARRKRKQTLQVSEEVLNAKPVAVIDLNSSPCKEMSPTEVISLTDSGDETAADASAAPADRRPPEYGEVYQTNETGGKSPAERRGAYVMTSAGPKTPPEPPIKFTVTSTTPMRPLPTNPIFEQDEELEREDDSMHSYNNKGPNTPPEPSNRTPNTTMYDPFEPTKSRSASPEQRGAEMDGAAEARGGGPAIIDMFGDDAEKPDDGQSGGGGEKAKSQEDAKDGSTATVASGATAAATTEEPSAAPKPSPAKEPAAASDAANETAQTNGLNTLVLDLSSLGDEFVPKSTIPLVRTSQGKYEFQGGKATPDKPITVVISQQTSTTTTPVKPLPQQVMVTPTRQIPTKPVEPIKQPIFPDILPWKLPPPLSQASFTTPPPAISTVTPTSLMAPSKTGAAAATAVATQNGSQDESAFELDDSPYSPASSEGDDLFEPPPLNAGGQSPKSRPAPLPAVNSYKSRVDALFSSSPAKKLPPRPVAHPKPIPIVKPSKKIAKTGMGAKKEVGIKADEEQLKILDDVPNSAVEMIVKEKFLKKLHRQERVVEEVKVVLKPHYAKKHITKEEYKDILRRAVPKICHNKTGDINPSKIQGLVEAYVKKIRHSKKKGPTIPSSTTAPMFPSVTTGKSMKKQKTLWG